MFNVAYIYYLVESIYIYILLYCVEENIIWWKTINKERENANIN